VCVEYQFGKRPIRRESPAPITSSASPEKIDINDNSKKNKGGGQSPRMFHLLNLILRTLIRKKANKNKGTKDSGGVIGVQGKTKEKSGSGNCEEI